MRRQGRSSIVLVGIPALVPLLRGRETETGVLREALDRVAHQCADTLERKGLVHLFGSGHSVIPTLEAFPRYGSFVGLNPLNDPRLMWHNVLGPGGVRELLWLERTENYIDKFLDHEPLAAGDVIVIYSHSGLNAVGIDAALYAKARGLFVVAVVVAVPSGAGLTGLFSSAAGVPPAIRPCA